MADIIFPTGTGAKGSIVNADLLLLADSADGNKGKDVTFAILKAAVTGDSNIIYCPIGGDIETYIAAATAGDTIVLAAGTYTITDDIDIAQSINVVGQGVGVTTIACTTASKKVFDISASAVRIADLSIDVTADISSGIIVTGVAGTVLSGVVLENLDIDLNSAAGVQLGIKSFDASLTIRNSTVNATSSDSYARAISVENAATAEAVTTVNIYNVDSVGTGSGGDNTYGILVLDSSATNDITANCYDSRFTAVKTGANEGRAIAVVGGDAIGNFYNCIANGSDADVFESTSGGLTLYDTTLVNGTTSGTITYGGTVVTSKLSTGGVFTPEVAGISPVAMHKGGVSTQVIEDTDMDDNDVMDTGITSGYGLLIVSCTTDGTSGVFRIENQTIVDVSSNALYSVTKDTDTKINVYWDTDQFKVQMLIDAGNKNVSVAFYGT